MTGTSLYEATRPPRGQSDFRPTQNTALDGTAASGSGGGDLGLSSLGLSLVTGALGALGSVLVNCLYWDARTPASARRRRADFFLRFHRFRGSGSAKIWPGSEVPRGSEVPVPLPKDSYRTSTSVTGSAQVPRFRFRAPGRNLPCGGLRLKRRRWRLACRVRWSL